VAPPQDSLTPDTTNDQIYNAKTGPGCCYGDFELTLSANQTLLSASSFLYDSDLNGHSSLVLNMKERRIVNYVYGAKLSPDGALLFQPGLDVIDVYDGRAGNLFARVSLPFTIAPTYDALVANGKDNVLVAITGPLGDGIAFIDLTPIPEPTPLTYTAPPALPSASGLSASRRDARSSAAVFRPLPHQSVSRLTTPPHK